MNDGASSGVRCAVDTVEVVRMEKLLRDQASEQLETCFSAQELADAGTDPGRTVSLAARFAAKEACCKLFPRETALGLLQPSDFSVRRDAFGAPQVEVTAGGRAVIDRHRMARVNVSLTHTKDSASAVAWAERNPVDIPWFGKWLYRLVPYRRQVVLGNLRRVFGETLPEPELHRLAQAYCGHFVCFLIEFLRLPFMSAARRQAWIRVENMESPIRAHRQGKGILLLVGHFGNFEVATVAGIGQYPQYRGLLHFVRRPLKPKWLNDFVTWRFRRAGFGKLAQRGSLDAILDLLSQGAIIVYPFDQHASRRDGVTVDFFGHPAGTHKSVALLALSTGAPVIPASSWREPDGRHVLRFEEPLPLIEHENPGEAIRLNTRAYNVALERILLRHPEQWIWMHRRWKVETKKRQ